MEAPFTVRAMVLEDGACQEDANPEKAIRDFADPGRTAWLHVSYQDQQAAGVYLEKKLGFHELAVEDSLSEFERPTLHEYSDHLFLSAAQVSTDDGAEDYSEIGFFLTATSLVTVTKGQAPVIDAWLARWKKNPDRIGTRPAELLHSVIDSIIDEYYVVADRMEDEVDDLIDVILRGDNTQLRALLQLKRRLIELRRRVTPMRDILNGLLRRDIVLIPPDTRPYFQDVYDHTLRLAELADISRDTLTSALDVHLSTVSNNLNNVMKKMTVISTVLMSGALIAGIYGMNFKYMPELQQRWGYPFALLLMVVAGLTILGLFRWKKWL
jgi:magnesium transporter